MYSMNILYVMYYPCVCMLVRIAQRWLDAGYMGVKTRGIESLRMRNKTASRLEEVWSRRRINMEGAL